MTCLFCRIIKQEIPAKIIYQDDILLAFHDIHPQAPIHVLIVPRMHIETINELHHEDRKLVGDMVLKAKDIAKTLGISADGYRLIFNCNKNGGQEIYHIHLHLFGGRQMQWPPG